MIKRNKAKFLTLIATIATLFSCLIVSLTGAKFFTQINGIIKAPAADFILTTNGNDNANLSVIPTENGSYTAYEFFVSNNLDQDVSDVNQYYGVGLLLPTQQFLSLMNSNIGEMFAPFLIYTDDMNSTPDELFEYAMTNTIPEGTTFEILDYFNLFLEPGDNELTEEELLEKYNDFIPFSWFLVDSNNNETPATFGFQANSKKINRHFLVFFAQGTLSEYEFYQINGMQLVVYSEQAN